MTRDELSIVHYSDDFGPGFVDEFDRDRKREYKRRWESKNPDKVRASQRRKYERHGAEHIERKRQKALANPDATRAKRRAEYAKNPRYWLERSRQSRFGITPAQYAEMLIAQGGKCCICSLVFDGVTPRQEHVDHDHVSGRVRGVLCTDCNLGLGRFKDNQESLRFAIAYLARHNTKV